MSLLLSALVSLAHAAHPTASLVTVATFDPWALETPESVAVDTHGNLFLSLALTGEIRKIDANGRQSTVAYLPLGAAPLTPCGSFIGIMGALALDHQGNLYATVASCDADDRGVWRVSPEGDTTLVANLPVTALPNGIVYREGTLYVADSEGLVWTLPADGSGDAQVWSDDPLLVPSPGHVFPGPNGIEYFDGELYVANSDQGTILAIPLEADGSAGAARIHASGIGCDDFAFDVNGSLYCTTDPFNTVVRVDPAGSHTVLLTAADGLDGPTCATFGRTAGENDQIYITNGAFPFFSTTHTPKLLRYDVGVAGKPRP